MKCSEVMTRDPSCCLPADTVFQAAQLMKSENVGSIPIVNDKGTKKLEGIVTDRDLAIEVVAEGRDAKTTLVRDVMTTNVVTCGADDNVDDALELMEEHQVRRIPIVDPNGGMVGIIAQADIATRLEEPEKTAELVEDISKAAASN